MGSQWFILSLTLSGGSFSVITNKKLFGVVKLILSNFNNLFSPLSCSLSHLFCVINGGFLAPEENVLSEEGQFQRHFT